MRQRIIRLEERCQALQEKRLPLQEMLEEIRKTMQLETLSQPAADYMQQLNDMEQIPEKMRRKKKLTEKMRRLKEETVDALEKEKRELYAKQSEKTEQIKREEKSVWSNQSDIRKLKEELVAAEGLL